MKFFRPTNFACAACVVAAVIAGCAKKPAADVLARVGDKDITVADFQAEYQRRLANHQLLPDRQTLLNQMVDRETYLQQARAAGLENVADVRHACENILIAKYQDTQLVPKMQTAKVSPEEIRAAYEQDKARYTQPAKAKLAFVFIETGAKADTNKIAAAEMRAQEALAKTAALPADARGFGQVAADYSDDQVTRYRGGDAGWFAADEVESRWPKDILAAGFALKNLGDVSGPLRGKEGFYLVKKLDARPETLTPLEQVQPAITRRLLMARQQEIERQFQTQARTAAKVTLDAALLATVSYPTQNQTKLVPAWPAAN